jgi:hypothetical protein
VYPNMPFAGAPDMPANKFSGIDVNPLQPWNVELNMAPAGAPDIFPNNPAGIEPVRPLQ